jgi:hypothetical protein
MKTFMISTNDDPELATKAEAEEAKKAAKKAEAEKVIPTTDEFMERLEKLVRDIELVDDVAGMNVRTTFEQNRAKIQASPKTAEGTLAKLAARLVEVKEKKATATQAAAREATVVAHSAPAMVAASTPPDEDLPFTPADTDKATPAQLQAIRDGMADLKTADPKKAKDLSDYIRSGHTTDGYTTHKAAVHVLKVIHGVLGGPVTLAA